ncbi:hypothetical protein GCM10009639_66180 [Kitasatospora putterlickiae]|uniref:Uncharacterized protein n=1 Tax=Kitasatospora putterlickiae TaxID=221725 RepID=A0ABN1YGZ3_9ACTN
MHAEPEAHAVADRGQAGGGGRDLHQQVGPVHRAGQFDGLRDQRGRVVGEPRVQVGGDQPVVAVGAAEDPEELLADQPQIVHGGGPDRALGGDVVVRQPGQLVGVGRVVAQRSGQQGRVGGGAAQAGALDQPAEQARGGQIAVDPVQPGRDALGDQRPQVSGAGGGGRRLLHCGITAPRLCDGPQTGRGPRIGSNSCPEK